MAPGRRSQRLASGLKGETCQPERGNTRKCAVSLDILGMCALRRSMSFR